MLHQLDALLTAAAVRDWLMGGRKDESRVNWGERERHLNESRRVCGSVVETCGGDHGVEGEDGEVEMRDIAAAEVRVQIALRHHGEPLRVEHGACDAPLTGGPYSLIHLPSLSPSSCFLRQLRHYQPEGL